jgi:hypothetical protein
VRRILALTTVLAAILITAAGTPAAIPFGVLLALVLPGYALVLLLWPGTPPWPATISPALTRTLWTCGLSLAVTVLAGLILNLIPSGLTRTTWTILLTAVTLLALSLPPLRQFVSARRHPSPPAPPPAGRPVYTITTELSRLAETNQSRRRVSFRWAEKFRQKSVIGYALATLIVTGVAIGLAVVSSGWAHTAGFAELWLVRAQQASHVTLGVRSSYHQPERFHLELRRGAAAIASWELTLAAGQSWQRDLAVTGVQRLTASLTSTATVTPTLTVALTPGTP